MACLQALPLSTAPHPPVAGVRLFFLPTRSHVTIQCVRGIQGSLTGVVADTFPLVDLAWRAQTVSGQATVRALVSGEPIVLQDLQWVPEAGVEPSMDAAWFIDPHDAADERRAYVKRLLRSREQAVACIDDPHLKGDAGFFHALDLASNPILLDVPRELAERVDLVAKALVSRVQHRARSVLADGNTEPLDLEAVSHSDLRMLTALQRPLFGRYFGQPVDADRVCAAFESFANGDLRPDRFQGWNGEPDSAHFFAFAEFAIACVGASPPVARSFWQPLVRPFVLAEEIYLTRYRPPGSPPYSWAQYNRWNRVNNPRVEPVIIRALRERYRPMTIDTLIQAHAVNAGRISGVSGHAPH